MSTALGVVGSLFGLPCQGIVLQKQDMLARSLPHTLLWIAIMLLGHFSHISVTKDVNLLNVPCQMCKTNRNAGF